MSEKIRKDALAILFLTLGLFLTVALVSFDQFDPSLSTWSSFDAPVHNWGGRVGATLADLLLQTFGIGAVGFPILCIGLAWWTFRGEGMGGKWTRTLGGLLAVCSILGGISFFAGHVRIMGQEVFLPGLVGLPGVNVFGRMLNTVGGVLCLSAMFLFSLMLLTGSSLSGLPSLWRREPSGDEVRAKVKERLAPRDDAWEKEAPRKEPPPPAPRDSSPRIVAAAPHVDEAPRGAERAGKAFVLPSIDFLEPAPPPEQGADETTLRRNAGWLLEMLKQHGIEGLVTEIRTGPLVTTYEFKPAAGVKISKVAALAADLALAMKCEAVRVVPNIPGKGVMGFEIPNEKRSKIVLREILGCRAFATMPSPLAIAIGKDLFGEPVVRDLAKMPHLMIAGATGAGKSVGMNSMILSILYRATPDEVRMLMIDPKMVELSPYDGIPHLRHPVVTDPRAAAGVLRWAVGEMNGRYQLLSETGVRHIDAYNQSVDKKLASRKARSGSAATEGEELVRLPYIVIVVDELADLLMATSKREIEALITTLAQKARAVGIHLIVATQRPSVDVISGLMKANFPARICYKVSSVYDSRTILDHGGGEALLGNGDMLFLQPGAGGLIRTHGPFVGDEEVRLVVEHLKKQGAPVYDESIAAAAAGTDEEEADASQDPLFDKAVEECRRAGRCSVSMIQRRLMIGYNRAARIVEAMERMGYVGPSEGGKPREVYGARRD
jgi:S-DNA-T family DNA segregation ATPase FtsK/SpoIIIE